MRKIKNPFIAMDSSRKEYNCFGCSPFNEVGLQLEFWENGDEMIAKWQPQKSLEGWTGVVHGGIQASLVDELAGWIVLVKTETSGVTADMNIKYIKPLYISKDEVTVKGRLMKVENRRAKIECVILNGAQEACAKAVITYFCFPQKIARAKYHYPGIEAFYDE